MVVSSIQEMCQSLSQLVEMPVMLGSMLAGTDEAPGETEIFKIKWI